MSSGLSKRPRALGTLFRDPAALIALTEPHPLRRLMASGGDGDDPRLLFAVRASEPQRWAVTALTWSPGSDIVRSVLLEPSLSTSDVERLRAVLEQSAGALREVAPEDIRARLANARPGAAVDATQFELAIRLVCRPDPEGIAP